MAQQENFNVWHCQKCGAAFGIITEDTVTIAHKGAITEISTGIPVKHTCHRCKVRNKLQPEMLPTGLIMIPSLVST